MSLSGTTTSASGTFQAVIGAAYRHTHQAPANLPTVRILLVTPYYAPAYAFGEPVVVAETLVTELVRRGHDVTVATTDVFDLSHRVPPGTPAQPDSAVVKRFVNVSQTIAARAMGSAPRGWLRWIRAHAADFDVVLLHDVYSVLSVGAARSAARAGVPFALQPLGSLPPTRERGRRLLKRAFLRLWGRRTLIAASALIYSTADERRSFLDAGSPRRRSFAFRSRWSSRPLQGTGGRASRPSCRSGGWTRSRGSIDYSMQSQSRDGPCPSFGWRSLGRA